MCLTDRYSYESDGKYLVAGSEDGNVIVVDGRASVNFRPIGYTCKKINCPILHHLYDLLDVQPCTRHQYGLGNC